MSFWDFLIFNWCCDLWDDSKSISHTHDAHGYHEYDDFDDEREWEADDLDDYPEDYDDDYLDDDF